MPTMPWWAPAPFPVPGLSVTGRDEAPAVVVHLEHEGVAVVADLDMDPRRPGVLDHVGQGLLDDPVDATARRWADSPATAVLRMSRSTV